MMEQNPARPARKVAIADHIWDAFEEMAAQMGTDRDGLVNQAMLMFARLNGFLEAAGGAAGSARPAVGASTGASSAGISSIKPGLTGARPGPPVLAPVSKEAGISGRRSASEDK